MTVLDASDTCVKDLESLIGLLHWILQISPTLRPWLCFLYFDKARPLGSNFSVSDVVWQRLREFLDDRLRFKTCPPGTSITPGSQLLSARHVNLERLDDLRLVKQTGRRMWMRVADLGSSKRRLSEQSRKFLLFWLKWCTRPQMFFPLAKPRFNYDVEAAADACAHGDCIGIGGWVRVPGQDPLWFSERFRVEDFRQLKVPVRDDAQSDIVSYETLAQVALILCYASLCRGGRVCVRLPSLTDNSGTESVASKLFSTISPLCFFLQQLAMVSWSHAVSLDTSHICGNKNVDADLLSRWDGCAALPPEWKMEYRVSCALPILWHQERDVRLFPPEARLLWQPPLGDSRAATLS